MNLRQINSTKTLGLFSENCTYKTHTTNDTVKQLGICIIYLDFRKCL